MTIAFSMGQLRDLADHVSKNISRYDYPILAIRVDSGAQMVGESLPASRVWVDGDQTDDELPGTCGFNVHQMPASYLDTKYIGTRVILMTGDFWEYGEDDGEIIIRDAKVLAIIA